MPRRKNIKRKRRKPVDIKLILIDHDGTLCNTNPIAYESIKYAFNTSVETLKLTINNSVDWEKAFSETRGTTEKNLIRYLCYSCGVPFDKTSIFEKKFYYFRSKWYENMKESNEYVWDTYYPDAHQLMYKSKSREDYIQWLVTGNPRKVIEQRLSNSMWEIFSDEKGELMGTFGDQAYKRSDLIKLALTEAESRKIGFRTQKDSKGFTKNVFYFADSRNDFFAGIDAKVRTIWVPSRSLQEVIDTKNRDYVKFISRTLKHRVIIVNDLYSKETQEFVGIEP